MNQQDNTINLTKNTTLAEFLDIILDRLIKTAENGPQPSAHHYPFAICVGRTPNCSTYIRASIVVPRRRKAPRKNRNDIGRRYEIRALVDITLAAINAVINSREGGEA